MKRLEGGKYVAKLELLSGRDEAGEQQFFNNSFIVDEPLSQKIQFFNSDDKLA